MQLLRIPTKYGSGLWLTLWPRLEFSIMLNGRYWGTWWKDGKFRIYRFDNIWRKTGTPSPKKTALFIERGPVSAWKRYFKK